ncbi:MAG: metallophosphoesterase [Candidatus Melainabacteria bacterium]|nr:metallophosphoesterase [Candidatus Melainabacteria bacterium]
MQEAAQPINLEHMHGPFDIIGDVHGCFDELLELLEKLGYVVKETDSANKEFDVVVPESRQVIFLGDLVDRGPASPSVLGLVMCMVAQNKALCVPGNHDVKFVKKLKGRDVSVAHGLAETLEQIADCSDQFRERVIQFFDVLPSHRILDDGKLVVAHAGIKESMQGKDTSKTRAFALYGDVSGENDEYGLPIRKDWGKNYSGAATVVHGHTPVREPRKLNRTICIDTGCVFGGKLTAYRYPEDELVSVQARKQYSEYAKPLT